ncbi:ABC transporter ATP-binding protein [Rhizobium sp. BK251]|uniref:ABC transporter ATP-binding protein n=1 Tax=Rhizobium sp. BK251 TaxID=2512125 RepID=UPI001048D7F2|nr:ABC transporter ATP-binding protein [Rhizobium sp. BK251]TCL68125.1 carbohydrate ABC transporter ATP-binding protein (CUT1 family) [Rhizobium sp. BK251]
MNTSLSIRRLAKHFDGVQALKSLDLEIPAGRLVTLLGPSGCGKTTLLRMIAGISDPTAGEIWLAGRRIEDVAPERRNFGMVFQTYALFPHMSVEKNVAFGLEMRGIKKAEIARRVAAALDLVGLAHLGKRLPRQLSGGQQQRVALARAVVIEPDVLLFDEPLSNLDAKLRDTLREDLRILQKKLGITSVYVTHDQSEAMALADEIVVMKDGEIVERGTPIDLYRRPTYRFTAEFLGMTNVIGGDLSGNQCRLPWGAVRQVENPGEKDAEGIAIRPEDIGIEAADGEFDGVIEHAVFMGAAIHYQVRAAGHTLRVLSTGGQNGVLEAGQQVKLTPPPAVHLLKTFRPAERVPV